MFCATEDSTGHTVKWWQSRDAHKWPTRNVFEHLWNITNIFFPLSVPRIAAVDEWTFPKVPVTSQISILCTPVLSGGYDVWGGTHATTPLNTNTIYITFTDYLIEMHETTCFALQIKRPSSLPTIRNQTNIFK